VDPVCHTLVGASLGATGLARKTRYGTATLLVAANLPDIDAVTYGIGGATAYALRRGVTHGLPALVVLPLLLAGVMAFVAKRRAVPAHDAPFRWLLALAALGVASHPALDWLNNYGMRWLMPFVDRWSYGDTLFIFDGFIWFALIAGLIATKLFSPRAAPWWQRPAIIALALVSAYIAGSFALTRVAMREALAAAGDDPPLRLMASPVPLSPLTRDIVLEYPDEYRLATVRFRPDPALQTRAPQTIAKGAPALLERAREAPEGQRFMSWARFPYAVLEETGAETVLWVADARYVIDLAQPRLRSFGFVRLELPR